MIRTGIEKFCTEKPGWARDRKLGLLCNQASVDSNLVHSRILMDTAFPGQLKALFSPQHGLFSEKQDNMKESGHGIDPVLGIPVFSLYEKTRTPSPEQLGLIDILVIDLQDVGTRVYTYIWTLLLAMKACAKAGISVAVLDRPNPIGGLEVEGNLLDEKLYSFVGMAPIPMRHGLTIAELAFMFSETCITGLDLHVVKMNGWNRDMMFPETGLPWVLPSPNMPLFKTALVYPGQVLLEGTNMSEGRGTTRPFEIFGAPYLTPQDIMSEIGPIHGAILREQFFEPTFNKWKGKRCGGFQIHVTEPQLFRPYRFTLSLIAAMFRTYPEEFEWSQPPYEYEYHKLPADLLIGNQKVRQAIEAGISYDELNVLLEEDEQAFQAARGAWLLYH